MNKKAKFEAIFSSHYPKVLRLCKGYFSGNEAMAKDMAQEVFIRAWQNLDNFREEAHVGTWIYRITVNTCLSEKRKAIYKREKKGVSIKEQTSTEYDDTKETQLKQLYCCINKLKDLDKMIIMLVLEGAVNDEIARVTGIKEASLRVRIHRIKNKLTKCANYD